MEANIEMEIKYFRHCYKYEVIYDYWSAAFTNSSICVRIFATIQYSLTTVILN
jgi:hypothetical protein